jgi:hypothetical protein
MATVTPKANEIPSSASKFIASHPTAIDPHFPGFKVWLERDWRVEPGAKRVLVFTKSSGYEHPLVYRDTAWPSPLEAELLDFGREHRINFVFSKDGTIFTPENLAGYDAFLFYTSGDPAVQPRDGLGDSYPLMTEAGKQALLAEIRAGKGFLGFHSTIGGSHETPDARKASPDLLSEMLGAGHAFTGPEERVNLTFVDKSFPGLEDVPAGFTPLDEWHPGRDLLGDLHVLLARGGGEQFSPIAWARREGKGRVYYNSLGHELATWKNPVFQKMLLGAIQWATGQAEADLSPNVEKFTEP